VYHATTAQQAVDYLIGKEDFGNRCQFPMPALIILNLHLADVAGFDLLQWIRSSLECASIPVLGFTSAANALAADTACGLGVNSCFTKPSNADALLEFVKSIGDYWLRWNKLPAPIP
jgi:DNA-binding response OmpR family regulator